MTTGEPVALAFRPIEEILTELDLLSVGSKRVLVDEIIERRGEIVHYLLLHLERVIANPEGYLDQEHDLLAYALVLLAYFREERAHPLFLSLLSLPGDIIEQLIGDMKTTAQSALLLRTCGGSLDGVRNLVLNRAADEYVRWATMETLCLAVVAGMAERKETVQFLAGLLTGEEAEAGSYFWTGVAHCLCDLYPDDVMEVVRMAYEEGLIHPSAIRLKDFELVLERGADDRLEELLRQLSWAVPEDLDGLLAFCERTDEGGMPGTVESERKVKQNVQKKKKKKMAKASRRKNR